jgi:Tfp pilus assembly protein PilN
MSALIRRISTGVGEFLRWWGQELGECGAWVIARVAPAALKPVALYIDDQRWVLMESERHECPSSGNVFKPPDVMPEEFSVALARHRRVHVVLQAECALVQSISLPLAALPHLNSAVALQFPKLLPLPASKLLTDIELIESDIENRTLTAELAALKRADLETLATGLEGLRIRIASVRLSESVDADRRFQFGLTRRGVDRAPTSRLDRWLLGTAATLGVTCLAVGATESLRADHALHTANQSAQPAAIRAAAHRTALDADLMPLKALMELEHAPTAAEVLRELTDTLPRDTWITTCDLKGRELRLIGMAPTNSALISHLNGSRYLQNVQLRSSMSAGVGTMQDRFEITATVKAVRP